MNFTPFLYMMMITLPLSSGNDLLDYVNTKDYWKTQRVEISVESMVQQLSVEKPIDISPFLKQLDDDNFKVREVATKKISEGGPAVLAQLEKAAEDATGETAARIAILIKQLKRSNSTGNVRKLMAIRSLGELKKAEATVYLKKLLTSKELFVADYAAAAIASIQGKEYQRPTATAKQMAHDLFILPKDCGVVAQLKLNEGDQFDIDKYMKQLGPFMGGFGFGGGNLKPMFKQMTATIISKTGNIRFNAVTFGMAEKLGQNEGFVMVVTRGQYHRDSAVAALKTFGKLSTIDGVPVISIDQGQVHFILPSNQQMVFVGGPRNNQDIDIKQVIAGIKAGDGGLKKNLEIMKLVKKVDRKKDFWLAAVMNDFYREAPVFKPFDNIVVHATNNKGELKFNLEANGSDEEKIKATVEMMQTELQKGIKQIDQVAKNIPMFSPIIKTMKSIKMSYKGTKATGSMTLPRELNAGLFPIIMLGGGMRAAPQGIELKKQEKPAKIPQAKPADKSDDEKK